MIRALSRLFRLRLSLLNAVSAMGGYLLYPAEIEWVGLWMTVIGVLFLASGASALNQVMEPDLDRLMERTRQRPLPAGELTAAAAMLLGGGSLLAGIMFLGTGGRSGAALLGALSVIWYLAVYTPLKRRSSWALVAGALCGALPPVIGWHMAGGAPTDYRIILLAGLLYLWQIPHFWLFQRRHADDYRRAGFPLLVTLFRGDSFIRLFVPWTAALICAAMLLPAFGIIDRPAALWYALFPLALIIITILRSEKFLFSYLNLFPLFLTILLFAQKH